MEWRHKNWMHLNMQCNDLLLASTLTVASQVRRLQLYIMCLKQLLCYEIKTFRFGSMSDCSSLKGKLSSVQRDVDSILDRLGAVNSLRIILMLGCR